MEGGAAPGLSYAVVRDAKGRLGWLTEIDGRVVRLDARTRQRLAQVACLAEPGPAPGALALARQSPGILESDKEIHDRIVLFLRPRRRWRSTHEARQARVQRVKVTLGLLLGPLLAGLLLMLGAPEGLSESAWRVVVLTV